MIYIVSRIQTNYWHLTQCCHYTVILQIGATRSGSVYNAHIELWDKNQHNYWLFIQYQPRITLPLHWRANHSTEQPRTALFLPGTTKEGANQQQQNRAHSPRTIETSTLIAGTIPGYKYPPYPPPSTTFLPSHNNFNHHPPQQPTAHRSLHLKVHDIFLLYIPHTHSLPTLHLHLRTRG